MINLISEDHEAEFYQRPKLEKKNQLTSILHNATVLLCCECSHASIILGEGGELCSNSKNSKENFAKLYILFFSKIPKASENFWAHGYYPGQDWRANFRRNDMQLNRSPMIMITRDYNFGNNARYNHLQHLHQPRLYLISWVKEQRSMRLL